MKFRQYLMFAGMVLMVLSCGRTLKDGEYSLTVLSTNDVHGTWFDSTYVDSRTRPSLMAVKYYVDSVRTADGAGNVPTDAKFGAGKPAGLAIGLSLILIHLVCINLTGTSVNPARSIGPALFAGGDALKDVWVFICAPLVGGALSAFCWKAMVPKEK